MAIAGLTLSTIAVIFGSTPFAIFSLLSLGGGLLLSGEAFYRNIKQGRGFGLPLAGIALCIVTLAHFFYWSDFFHRLFR